MEPPAAESVPASPGVTLFPACSQCRSCSLANPGVWFDSGELVRGWGDPGAFSWGRLVQRGAVIPCSPLGWLWGPRGTGLRGVPTVGWQHTWVVLVAEQSRAEQGRAGAVGPEPGRRVLARGAGSRPAASRCCLFRHWSTAHPCLWPAPCRASACKQSRDSPCPGHVEASLPPS